MISTAAMSFQIGSGSPRNSADAAMPDTGISRAKGEIVAAG